jgi:hypothetical protein
LLRRALAGSVPAEVGAAVAGVDVVVAGAVLVPAGAVPAGAVLVPAAVAPGAVAGPAGAVLVVTALGAGTVVLWSAPWTRALAGIGKVGWEALRWVGGEVSVAAPAVAGRESAGSTRRSARLGVRRDPRVVRIDVAMLVQVEEILDCAQRVTQYRRRWLLGV